MIFIVLFLFIEMPDFCTRFVFVAMLAITRLTGFPAFGTVPKSNVVFTWSFAVFRHNDSFFLGLHLAGWQNQLSVVKREAFV